jgi:2-hydroxychromene-2-carboxylate isomerase
MCARAGVVRHDDGLVHVVSPSVSPPGAPIHPCAVKRRTLRRSAERSPDDGATQKRSAAEAWRFGAQNGTLGIKAMPSTTIRFYFDYESPNAYLAWTQLPKLAQRYGFTVDPAPILYAALLDAHGQLGPGEFPAKGRWMSKNLARKAVLLGVPLNPPAFLPFNPLLALRTTLLPSDTRERDALIDALFQAVWVRGLHVSETAVVERVANEIGLPGATLVAKAQTPEIKNQLRVQTDQAISRGVFGVPSMEVGDELFWGYDDFPYLELFLAGKDPVDATELARRSRPVQPSSVRRRFRSTNEGA